MKGKILLLVLLVIILIVVVYGFRNSSDDENVGSAQLTPFEFIIDWQAEPTYLGVYYARSSGLFERLGLDVDIITSWGAHNVTSSVAAGKYKIGTASGGATVIANSNGAEIVSLGVLYPKIPTTLFGLGSKGIEAPEDLKGKRIGVYPNSITKDELKAFMKINGINDDDVEIVSLTGADIPLVLSDTIDASLNYTELSPVQLALDNEVYEILLAEYGVTGYGLNIVTSRSAYETEQELIRDVSRAVVRAYRDGCRNKDDAVASFLEEFPEKDPNYVANSWERVCDKLIDGNYGDQNERGWQETIDTYKELGLLGDTVFTTRDILP
ncbi:MAG: ABC transporter substrate-binding protein [Candidatus Campbellbacteria bacterium]|nr:ABC transporter substrate-binding protein [Candidatus Campbellbacteria bacterium]